MEIDPQKLLVTIEAGITERSWVARNGRSGSGLSGARGIDRPIAQRLIASAERVLDVPAKLAARARFFDTGRAAVPRRSSQSSG
jgi:hypothetical protein